MMTMKMIIAHLESEVSSLVCSLYKVMGAAVLCSDCPRPNRQSFYFPPTTGIHWNILHFCTVQSTVLFITHRHRPPQSASYFSKTDSQN